MFKSKISFVPQLTQSDCGVSCLAMILSYYGCHTDTNHIKSRYPSPNVNGWSLLDIKRAAGKFGLESTGMRVINPNYFSKLKKPVILFWNFSHFVVLESVQGENYTIIDPKYGRILLNKNEFLSKFSGYVMEFGKKEDFVKVRKSFKKEWQYLKKFYLEKKWIYKILLFSILSQVMVFSTPIMIQEMINRYTEQSEISITLSITLCFLLIFYFIFNYINGIVKANYQERVDYKSTDYFVNHLFSLHYLNFQKRSAGDLTVRTFGNQNVRNLILNHFVTLIVSTIMIIGSFAYMFYINWQISTSFLILCILLFLTNFIFVKKLNYLSFMENYYLAEQRGKLNESLNEYYFIKANNIVTSFTKNWLEEYTNYLDKVKKRMKLQFLADTLQNFIRYVALFGFLIAGFLFFLKSDQQIGTIVMFVGMSSLIFGPVTQISTSILTISSTRPMLLRILDILGESVEEDTTKYSTGESTIRGEISFNDISFYFNQEERMINNLNLSLRQGENIAIIGKTGSGKTTLLNLLLRIYDSYDGSIKIDNKDIKSFSLGELREQIGLITQDSVLFNGTLKENLDMFGCHVNEHDLKDALEKSQLKEDLKSWPRKVHVPIVEGGKNFSGGQRQRLSMIRIFLKRYPILLLDEPTNHLDERTSMLLMNEIIQLPSTKIFITHNDKILERMDKVYEMKDGKLILVRGGTKSA
ncbi:peptidase domain-containing ABC transporter [Gracilibacillus xinjiangensis]|uniref:Peptidase domain-containing ABC transporter n=1 Tax=Gracilibacillus xinjiangensis TaxID=1193282 RepID=A0ABV8WTT6_9BACI